MSEQRVHVGGHHVVRRLFWKSVCGGRAHELFAWDALSFISGKDAVGAERERVHVQMRLGDHSVDGSGIVLGPYTITKGLGS